LFILILNLKNKLFFGDSGIYLISSILIISLIYEYNFTKNIVYADEIFYLFLLPGFDLIRLTFQRTVLKKNIFFGDRNHLHHLLMKRGSLINANLILFGLSAFPILAFSYIKLNFYMILVIFLILYFSLLIILDKMYVKKI
jgi:UDP-GlcNAc:undecaprenyl-phosphate GlcNAc-1-phosphate transferase